MKKLFFNLAATPLLVAAAAILTLSCVNEDYDLSKGVDMDMTLLQNTTIPIGNVSTISIQTLLGDTGSGTSVFDVDKNGNMSLSFGGDELSSSFTMPEVSIGGEGGMTGKDAEVIFHVKKQYAGKTGHEVYEILHSAGLPDEIHYSDGDSQKELEAFMPIELDKELPEQIISIRTINMDADMDFVFTVEDGVIMYLKDGFKMEFPSYMVLERDCESADYEVIDNNVVIFKADTKLTSDSPLVLNLAFKKMDDIEPMIVEKENAEGNRVRYFVGNDDVVVTGDLYIKPSDYGYNVIPADPMLTMHIELDNLDMTSADVKIDMDMKIEDKRIEIGELPEMFSGDGTVLDLYNPIFRIRLDNNSPLAMDLNAGITSYSGRHTTDIHIGDYCINGDEETASIIIPAEGEEEYFFSRRGKHDSNKGEDIELEHLGDIITEEPDSIVIHDIFVEAEDTFIMVEPMQEYVVHMEYEFFCPLAFGKDLSMTFGYDVDLGLGGGALGLDSLILSMDMLNSIPLDFNIKGVAVDSLGNEIRGASVDMDLDLAAGTADSPVSSPVEVVVSANGADASISKLRLMLHALAPEDEDYIGESLNISQGIALDSLAIALPKGITLDLTNNDSNYSE